MLDSNLLAFFLADSKDGPKHHATFYQTRAGSEPDPAYSLVHPDPEQQSSRNCYAVALFDPYVQDVLYGEVLLQPKWSQPTLSQDEIRRNGGVAPPPEPTMPTEFVIQLYNPDQQIHVNYKSTQLLGGGKWEFGIPMDTFRTPSSSMLDKSQNDPGAAVTTPKINFVWKRSNNFTKELTCFVTGKSTDLHGKKKSKEPDIAIALFKGLREITVYEPNLYRVDLEDPKGLEVVLLLSAAVIRDVFFGNLKQAFNVSDPSRRPSGPSGISSSPPADSSGGAVISKPPPPGRPHARSFSSQSDLPEKPTLNRVGTTPAIPSTNPRTQWEIDAETARLKAQTEAEEREQRRQEEIRRRERERQAAEETKRLRKMVEQEEKERKAEQRRIEKETERLKKQYGQQGPPPPHQSFPWAPPQHPPRPQVQLQPTSSSSPTDYAASMSNALAFSPGFGVHSKPLPPPPQSHSAPIPQQPFAPPPMNYYGYHPPPTQPTPQPGAYPLPFLPQNPPPVVNQHPSMQTAWLQPRP